MEALWATILFSGFALEVIIRRIIKCLTVFSRVGSIISGQCLPTCVLRGLASLPLRSGLQPGRILTGGAYIWVTLGRDSIPLLTAGRNAAAVRTAVRFINSIYVITTINSGFHIPVDDNPAAMRAYPNPLLEFQSFIR